MRLYAFIVMFVAAASAFAQFDGPDAMTLRKMDPSKVVSMLSCGNRNYGYSPINNPATFTLNGGMTALDQYYRADGTNSFMSILGVSNLQGNLNSGAANFTASCWFKVSGKPKDATSGLVSLMNRRNNNASTQYWVTYIRTNSTSVVSVFVNSSGVSSGIESFATSPYDGNWHFVAVSYANPNVMQVVDRTNLTVPMALWTGVDVSQILAFGSEQDPVRTLAGNLMFPSYWNRALSLQELQLVYETERLKVLGQ